MSHLEYKNVKDVQYVSFVKKFNLMNHKFRIYEHVGKNISTMDKKEYLKRNLETLSRKEFDLRKALIEDLEIAYYKELLFEVEMLSIRIDNLLEIKENKDVILVEFAKDFIFNSNNIEGSRIPADEVKKIIETGNSRYQNTNEVKEVFNSIEAMNFMNEGFKFNIPSIKRLYYIITKDLHMSGGEPYPKGFKDVGNVVNNMETTPPEMVIPMLTKLLGDYQKIKKKEHPLKLAFDFHLRYEGIHPFLDGNGRTGRMLMNKILMSNGYFPVIIHSENSTAYYNSISKGLGDGNKRAYYQFMLKQTRRTYRDFSKRIEFY